MIKRIDELVELSSNKIAFWVFSKKNKTFEYISPRVGEIFESPIGKFSNSTDFRRLVHPDDQNKVIRNLNAENLEYASEVEFRILTKDDKVKWLRNVSVGVKNGDGRIDSVIGCTYLIENDAKERHSNSAISLKGMRILKSLPDSFFIVNLFGKIVNESISPKETCIFKRVDEPLIGMSLKDALDISLSNEIGSKLNSCIETGTSISFELEIACDCGNQWFEVRMMKIQSDSVLVCIRNITDILKRLRKMDKFYDITEQSDELIMMTDVSGIIEYVNPKVLNISGYSYEELIGKKSSILKSGKHESVFYETLWNNVLNGSPFKGEFINLKKNGEYYFEEKIITPLSNASGKITNFISTGRDVTQERKNEIKADKLKKHEVNIYEKEEKSRTLSLIKSNEIERKNFAKEIHEGLNQMLSVAMANLDSLIAKNVISTEEKSKIEFINELVSEIIHELRGISSNLSPINLYEFGLHPVIKQIVDKTNSNHPGINIEFSSNIANLRFRNEVEINVYRIIQEGVLNIVKHSNASKASVEINYINGVLKIEICDNGEGINMNTLEFKKMNNFGILNIEARMKSMGGNLNVTSKREMGFIIEGSINTKIISL